MKNANLFCWKILLNIENIVQTLLQLNSTAELFTLFPTCLFRFFCLKKIIKKKNASPDEYWFDFNSYTNLEFNKMLHLQQIFN